jgi:soluble lytic murein transglycosylase-like protein
LLRSAANAADLGAAIGGTPALLAARDAYSLAQRYEHGEGVAQDQGRALALYCDAARGGEAKALFNLGWMHLNGRGVPRDDARAVAWLRRAAERGSEPAVNLLRLLSGIAPAQNAGCDPPHATPIPSAPAEIRTLVETTAHEIGVDSHLVMAIIAVESAFNPRAVSRRNARGLMQLMPETAARFGVRDPFDERENVRGGTRYLRQLLTRFEGNLTLALAAYNAGEAAIEQHGGVPPFQETQDYVKRVQRLCACSAILAVASR